jgi:hypothetical protein
MDLDALKTTNVMLRLVMIPVTLETVMLLLVYVVMYWLDVTTSILVPLTAVLKMLQDFSDANLSLFAPPLQISATLTNVLLMTLPLIKHIARSPSSNVNHLMDVLKLDVTQALVVGKNLPLRFAPMILVLLPPVKLTEHAQPYRRIALKY